MDATLWQRQVELEQEMGGLGARRFWDEVARAKERGMESATIYGQHLAKHSVVPLANAITEFLDSVGKKRGAKPLAVRFRLNPFWFRSALHLVKPDSG